jgi:transcription initiation factor TFIID subunit TAF12
VSRQKLQEIVSQIDNKEKLDPDAEELMIMIAEEFVESVTQFACLLAKHRNSSTLEVKDLQLHLGTRHRTTTTTTAATIINILIIKNNEYNRDVFKEPKTRKMILIN